MLHVNRIYTQHYGFGNRLAIAHMPHLIDRNVFREFKAKFSQQWEETSSHKIRQSNDMQFVSTACFSLTNFRQNRFKEQKKNSNLCSFAMFLLTYSMFYPYVVCYPSFLLFSNSESAKRNLYNNHVKYILKESPSIRFDLILNKEFHVSLLRSEAERSGILP